MDAASSISKIASLIGDPSRAAMLWSLLGGESRPASELAMLANVSPQTASNHLKLLLSAGLVRVSVIGRNKFYRLAGAPIAAALESLAVVVQPHRAPQSLAHHTAPDLVFARTCYDHLAGELGVALLQSLAQREHLIARGQNFELASQGEKFLATLEIDVAAVRAQRRRFAYACLDWSQRVPHLGGALAAALLDWMFRTKLTARHKTGRALRLTTTGEKRLDQLFGIRIAHNGKILAA